MSSTRTMGISVTDVDTAAVLPLGFEYHQPAGSDDLGPKVWIYVYNDDASSFVQGTIVARDGTTTTYDGIIAPVDAPTARIMGVAQHTIVAGSYGFIQKKGIAEVLADTGGVTADNALVVGNAVAGRADNVGAVTTAAFGYTTESVAATALATCWINCPG